MFTSELDLVMETGGHYLLHRTCHHQIVHLKFSLKVHYPVFDKSELKISNKRRLVNFE